MKIKDTLIVLFIVGAMSLVANAIEIGRAHV